MLNGDINLKINKKIGVAILSAMSLFAAADFVSFVDADSAGGIVIEKETMDVGSVVFRMDDKNPADIYGGTWQLITGDATLAFGDGTPQSGISSGNNDPLVPLVEHSHTMNHDHPSVTTSTNGNHSHGWRGGNDTTAGRTAMAGGKNSLSSGPSNNAIYAAGNHNHTVDLPNYNGNTGNAGVSNATLDVRGERITINVWKRIN